MVEERIGTPLCLFIGVVDLQWCTGASSGEQQWWKRERNGACLLKLEECVLLGQNVKGEWLYIGPIFHLTQFVQYLTTSGARILCCNGTPTDMWVQIRMSAIVRYDRGSRSLTSTVATARFPMLAILKKYVISAMRSKQRSMREEGELYGRTNVPLWTGVLTELAQ
jgi:hypothetical protein